MMSLTRHDAAFDSFNDIATLRIELRHTDPSIWRQVEVPTSIKLKTPHDIIQAVMGWFDYHLRFAKAAGAGEMLNIHDFKLAYEQAIGHDTSNSTVYDLLARHGWRKLMPRPFHPRQDIAAQNAFKKTAFLVL
jgi:hypothetical protein